VVTARSDHSPRGRGGRGYGAAAAADYDRDGWVDLYLVNVGANVLYRSRGDGTFEGCHGQCRRGDKGTGVGATWADVDHDGWLDLFVANYLTFDPATISEQNPGAYPGPLAYPGEANVLYRNRGDGTFEDVTQASGLRAPGHRAMSVRLRRRLDGDSDFYCATIHCQCASVNDGQGRFSDRAVQAVWRSMPWASRPADDDRGRRWHR
jgi:hypothetical protein